MRQAGPAECGKISKALWITQAYPEEIEADFHRYYSLDFVDFFRPGSSLGWRKLLVLVSHLPPESAVNTAIRRATPESTLEDNAPDPVKVPWSAVELLMAALIDEVRHGNWIYVQAHSEGSVPKPAPIKRPGVSGKQKLKAISLETAMKMDPRLRGLSREEAQAKLDAMTGRRGGS